MLKAGVLEVDGLVKHPVTGCPQGGVISPILANIYLHYALDIWFEKRVKRSCKGMNYICIYADDFVCAFQYKKDAVQFYRAVGERLKKFGLDLAQEKTNIISFHDFAKRKTQSLNFWGLNFAGECLAKEKISSNDAQRRAS